MGMKNSGVFFQFICFDPPEKWEETLEISHGDKSEGFRSVY